MDASSFVLLLFIVFIGNNESQLIQKLQDKMKKVASERLGVNVARHDYEEMMLFPNVGFQRKEGDWRLNLHGWRFQSSKRNKFLGESSSAAAERLARLVASSEQMVYFNDSFQRDRLKPFMVEDEKNEKIHIMIGTKHNYTTKTDGEGQFRTSFIIPNGDVQEIKQTSNENQVITYKAIGDNADLWEGKVFLLERQGLSIISDIDDTIKISEVIDKIRLVANTFIHGFRVVEGKMT
jgi:phosphatidate phosphatase APP1